MTGHRAVFLDRDGTMIEDVGYLDRLERLKLFPYTVNAVGLLKRGGFKVVVVTSQNGIANGILTEEFLSETHAYLSGVFAAAGTSVEAYYYCPHSAHASVERYRVDCDCRKPKPGMILAAARDHDIDLDRSFVVGDRWRDIEMGLAAGTRAILVQTGYGKTQAGLPLDARPGHVGDVPIVANLIDAVSLILKDGV